jgi:hypothetical protein
VGLKLLTAPTIWPVSLAAARQQVRIVHDDDDLLLWNDDLSNPGLVQLATRYLEQRWNVSLLAQQWELSADGWYDQRYWREGEYIKAYRSMFGGRTLIGDILNVGGVGRVGAIYLPRPPLETVDKIQYFDSNGVLQTLATTVYEYDSYNRPGRVSLKPFQIWPFPQIGKVQDAVRIQFTSGFTSVANLFTTWPGVIQAIKILVATWYQSPEASVTGTISTPIKWTLDELSSQYDFNVMGW